MHCHPTVSRLLILLTFVACLTLASQAPAAPVAYTVTDLGTLEGPSSAGFGINAGGQVTGLFYTGGAYHHAFLWSPTTPNGTSGSMQDLGLVDGLGLVSAGRAINASGQVAGTSDAVKSGILVRTAFLYGGAMSDLGTLGGYSSEAWGINDSGHVTGGSHTAGNTAWHAFLYDGTMHDLGSLGGSNSMGLDVNASGQVTGESSLAGDANSHAFLYDGVLHDLGTLGGTSSAGWGINDSGQVTGYSYTTSDATFHAFLYDGAMQDLGTLGGPHSYGRAINASGQVVGNASTPAGAGSQEFHAFLYDSGTGMVDLNLLIDPLSGWELAYANGINDFGQITGTGFHGDEYHAFLLTPVPEPASGALLAMALPFLAWWCLRQATASGRAGRPERLVCRLLRRFWECVGFIPQVT